MVTNHNWESFIWYHCLKPVIVLFPILYNTSAGYKLYSYIISDRSSEVQLGNLYSWKGYYKTTLLFYTHFTDHWVKGSSYLYMYCSGSPKNPGVLRPFIQTYFYQYYIHIFHSFVMQYGATINLCSYSHGCVKYACILKS